MAQKKEGAGPGVKPVAKAEIVGITPSDPPKAPMITNEAKVEVKAPEIPMAPTAKLLKLDLAAGQNVREGYEGVDIWEGSKHVVDLMKFPWPWADDSAETLHCSHFIEHIPCRTIEERDIVPGTDLEISKKLIGKDMFLAFFDECWRILKHDGKMSVICPCARNNRAFQDPTHRRFIVAETFLYLNEPFRKANKLDHYKVVCNYSVQCDPVVLAEMTVLHPEVQQRRFNESWNTILDWSANLTAVKVQPQAAAPAPEVKAAEKKPGEQEPIKI